MKSQTMTLILMTVLIACAVPCIPDTADADSSIVTEDGIGNTIVLDDVPEHIIAIGKGVNATLIRLGVGDKIVVCDNYSTNANDPELDLLDQRKTDGDLLADGNIYSSGRSGLIDNCIYAVDRYGFDKENDVIIMTGSEGYVQYMLEDLKGFGFRNIAVWYDISSFGELCDYAESISLLSTGAVSDEIIMMRALSDSIADALGSTEKRDAMCVTYSGGEFKVNNVGSLAGSMIIAAGGNAFTIDGSKPSPTYSLNIPNTFSNGKHADAVVFVDHQIMNNEETLSKLLIQLPESVTIVGLKPLWNNFDIESMDGVQTMAQSMYPQVFGEYISDDTSADDEDSMSYAIAMVISVILISTGFMVFTRK